MTTLHITTNTNELTAIGIVLTILLTTLGVGLYHIGYRQGVVDTVKACPTGTVSSTQQLNGDIWCDIVPHATYGRATKRVRGTSPTPK